MVSGGVGAARCHVPSSDSPGDDLGAVIVRTSNGDVGQVWQGFQFLGYVWDSIVPLSVSPLSSLGVELRLAACIRLE